MTSSPIFIGGIGGSGTRLVANVLDATGVFIGDDLNQSSDALPFERTLERFLPMILDQVGMPNYRLEDIDANLQNRVLEALNLATVLHLRDCPEGAVWAAKSPRFIYLLPFLNALFPDMRFIQVIRDGRDMAQSSNQNQLRKHYRSLFDNDIPPDRQMASLELWNQVNQYAANLGQKRPEGRHFLIRYEDLCGNPANTIQAMLSRLSITAGEEQIRQIAGTVEAKGNIGRWRTDDTLRADELTRSVKGGLSRFAYIEPQEQQAQQNANAKETALLILGCHRSGTSAFAGLAAALGFEPGQSIMEETEDNPLGYWENLRIVQLNNRLMQSFWQDWRNHQALAPEWFTSDAAVDFAANAREMLSEEMRLDRPWLIKDPRICRLLPFWSKILRRVGRRDLKAILVLRHPGEIALSLAKRDGLDFETALKVWARHIIEAERNSRDISRIVLSYDELCQNPQAISGRMQTWCGQEAPNVDQTLPDIIRPELKHYSKADLGDDAGDLPDWAAQIWDALIGLLGNDDPASRAAMSEAAANFDREAYPIEPSGQIVTATFAPPDLNGLRAIDRISPIDAAFEHSHTLPIAGVGALKGYDNWRKSVSAQEQPDDARLRQQLSKLGDAIYLSIIVCPRDGSAPPAFQFGTNWIKDSKCIEVIDQRQIPEDRSQSPKDWLDAALEVARGKWLVIIEPDGSMAGDALHALFHGFENHSGAAIMHSDFDIISDRTPHCAPVFKPPRWDKDLHLQQNILRGWIAVRSAYAARFEFSHQPDFEAVLYDWTLQLTDSADVRLILHFPAALAHVRDSGRKSDIKSYRDIRSNALQRLGHRASVLAGPSPEIARIRYDLPTPVPGLTVIIPTRDGDEHLRTCIHGLLNETDYDNLSVIIVDNGSRNALTLDFLQTLNQAPNVQVIRHDAPFNFSELINLAVGQASTDLICLLNDDIEIKHPNWLKELAGLAVRPDVGAAGPLLLLENGRVQHAGVVFGLLGYGASHNFHYSSTNEMRDVPLAELTHEFSAVTAACLVMRREVYNQIGGMDAENLQVNFNDVDMCLKIRQAGLKCLWTPHAWMMHGESISRGREGKNVKSQRITNENSFMTAKWKSELAGDRYWNANFSIERSGPSLSFLRQKPMPWRKRADMDAEALRLTAVSLSVNSLNLRMNPPFHAAKLCLVAGQMADSFRFAREALLIEPDSYTANLSTGTVAANQGETDLAFWLYAAATRMKNFSVRPWNHLARMSLVRQQPFHALRYVQRAIEIDPKNLDARKFHQQSTAKLLPEGDPEHWAVTYSEWVEKFETGTARDLGALEQRRDKLNANPLISVVMPVFETPEKWLREAIESVQAQFYPNWELCIADDCSKPPHVRQILSEFQEKDDRIKVAFRETNGGISAASNDALKLASGKFVALLDHDDILPRHALLRVAEELEDHPNCDLIFSDEDKIDEYDRRYEPYFKTDLNTDLLYGHNMVSHLGVYRREKLEALKGFRKGYDGSQDYDLALRFIASTDPDKIRHIPEILYHWRAILGSAALDADAKPVAILNARRAIRDHLQAQGKDVEVVAALSPYVHHVVYPLPKKIPAVSVICGWDHGPDQIDEWRQEIVSAASYPALEFEDGSELDAPAGSAEFYNRLAEAARGEVLCFIAQPLQPLSPEWLEELVRQALRPEVAVAGPSIFNHENRLVHAGLVPGLGNKLIGRFEHGLPRSESGFMGLPYLTRSVTAMPLDCLVIEKNKFSELGGFNAKDLPAHLFDVDLCLRAGQNTYLNIYVPKSRLQLAEPLTSVTAEWGNDDREITAARQYIHDTWASSPQFEPDYNPNLDLRVEVPAFGRPRASRL